MGQDKLSLVHRIRYPAPDTHQGPPVDAVRGTMLCQLNPHANDALLTFDEPSHTYTHALDNTPVRTSVTGLIRDWFSNFDGPAIVHRQFGAWLKDPNGRYCALLEYMTLVQKLSQEDAEKQVLALWKVKGELAAAKGTAVHQELEDYYNGTLPTPTPGTKPPNAVLSWLTAMEWWNVEYKLQPWRSEFKMVLTATDDDGQDFAVVAGCADMLLRDCNGGYWLLDWKNVAPKDGALLGQRKAPASKFQHITMCNAPFDSEPCDKYTQFSVQTLIYAYILRKQYGLPIVSVNLVQFHESMPGKCHIVPAADLAEAVDVFMDLQIAIAQKERRLAKAEKEGREPTVEELAAVAVKWQAGFITDLDF